MILKASASRVTTSYLLGVQTNKQTNKQTDRPSSSFVTKLPAEYGSIAQAEDLGGSITDSSQGLFTRGSGPGVVVGGDNNGTIVNGPNTGEIQNGPASPSYAFTGNRYSRQTIGAHVNVLFDGGGLKSAGLTLNYKTRTLTENSSATSNVDIDSSKTNTSSNDVVAGFTIGYERTNKPTPERVEGADRAGKELIRAQEGGNTLNFVFVQPLDKGDSVVKVVVTKGNTSAAATIKRPDGSTYVEKARIKQ
jgi:hypothetical protein